MAQLSTYLLLLQHRLRTLQDETNRERGGLSVEAVLLIGFLVTAALFLGAFLVNYVKTKTGQIK